MPGIITTKTRSLYERPPPGPLAVNWAHHASRGIVAAWPFGGGAFGGFNVQNPTRYKLATNNAPATRSTLANGYSTNYNGTNQDSELASTAVIGNVTSLPATLECWCVPTSDTAQQFLLGCTDGDAGANWILIELAGNVAGDPARSQVHDNTGPEQFAASTNSYKINAPNHVIGVFPGTALRWVQLNGTGYGQQTASEATSRTLSRTMTGAFRVSTSYFSPYFGDMHSAIVRNVALSPTEATERADPGRTWAWLHQLGKATYSFAAPAAPPASGAGPYYYNQFVAQVGPGGGF